MLGALTTRYQHSLICALQSITCHGLQECLSRFPKIDSLKPEQKQAVEALRIRTRRARCPGHFANRLWKKPYLPNVLYGKAVFKR